MIKFILKGILRDKSRSLFPVITVSVGVLLTVFLYSYVNGFINDLVNSNARLQTGHVKVTTTAYAELMEQRPNDLALINLEELRAGVDRQIAGLEWVERIYFGGLIDIPDDEGNTREQTFFSGIAVDILSPNSLEHELLNPAGSIVRGKSIENSSELLISEQLAQNLNVKPGDEVTLISETMENSMAMANFRVAGTISFGVMAMDRSALIIDIKDARNLLDMHDAAGELLGFFPNFNDKKAEAVKMRFNESFNDPHDEFSPIMLSMLDQDNLRDLFIWISFASELIIFIFVVIMSIVLWNAGLMNGIRRYGEIGLRLAIGENKLHLYRVMIYESALIGLVGSLIGTIVGLLLSYYVQNVGIDISGAMPHSSMMMSDVLRANVTTGSYYIGFFPGLLATTFGSALAGVGIIKRNTAQLFKELES